MRFSHISLKKISLFASSVAVLCICLYAYTFISAPKEIGVSNQTPGDSSDTRISDLPASDQPLVQIDQTPQETPPASTQPQPTPEKILGDELKSTFSDGTYLVGIDVTPGTYETTNPSAACLYEKLSGTTTSTGKVSLRTNGRTETRTKVTIEAADTAFMTTACGTWNKIN